MIRLRSAILAVAVIAISAAVTVAAPAEKNSKILWLYPEPLVHQIRPPTAMRVAPMMLDYGYDSAVTSAALVASHGHPIVPIIMATYEFGFSTLLSPALVPKAARTMYGEMAQLKNNPKLGQIASLPGVKQLVLLRLNQLEFSQKLPSILPPVGLESRTFVFVEMRDGRVPPGPGWIRYDSKKTQVRFRFSLDGDPEAMPPWKPTLWDLREGRAMPESIRKQWDGTIRKWEQDQSRLDRLILHRPDLEGLNIDVSLVQDGKFRQLGHYMSGPEIRGFLGMNFFKRMVDQVRTIFGGSRARKMKAESLRVTPDSDSHGCLVTALRRRLLGKISPQ